jgi:putative aminopeptidase FrvX
MKFDLLQEMCKINATSGDEILMTEFLLDYIEKNKKKWKTQPVIHAGDEFQESIVLVFGKPKTAVFAHIDNIGFTAGYKKDLIKIGGPRLKTGYQLHGKDSEGEVFCEVKFNEKKETLQYKSKRKIEPGTPLSFVSNWREDEEFIQSCYMDNRLGVWNCLQIAEKLENGILVFSCREEHGGGSAEFLGKFIYEKYGVRQALISDITWVTAGVQHGRGVALSLRDSGLPRRQYVNRIVELAKKSKIPFQIEVESAGGSDGNALQRSPYPFDWMFIGAPEDNVHTPDEKVHKKDIETMLKMYQYLLKHL